MDGSTDTDGPKTKHGERKMNDYKTEQQEARNADDFLGGNYLKKEDLRGDTIATIEGLTATVVLGDSRKKLIVSFRELEKPLILNKTNIRELVQILQTKDIAAWKGRQVMLYVENSVSYGGKIVGGIRVRQAADYSAATANGHSQTVAGADIDC
jgi:hypothetical protein